MIISKSKQIYMIIGLPGSGKTTYGKKLADELGADFIDDIGRNGLGIISEKQTVVVTDVLCIRYTPEQIISKLENMFGMAVSVVFIVFENNPSQCIQNVKQRNDGRLISDTFIESLSSVYDPWKFSKNNHRRVFNG